MLPSVYLHQFWQSCLFLLWFNTGTRCGRPYGDVFARLLVTGTRGNWCTYISYCRPLQWRQVGRLNIPNLDSQSWSGLLREIAHDYPLSCIQSISQSVLHPTYSWGLRFWVCHPWGLTMSIHYVPINSMWYHFPSGPLLSLFHNHHFVFIRSLSNPKLVRPGKFALPIWIHRALFTVRPIKSGERVLRVTRDLVSELTYVQFLHWKDFGCNMFSQNPRACFEFCSMCRRTVT